MKVHKTNAMRKLDSLKMLYEALPYEADEHLDGVHVAQKLGLDPSLVFKTLVMKSESAYHVCLIASDQEVDLKKAAKAHGVKRLELIPTKDLLALTGYERGGCSPLAMKKALPTVIDVCAFTHPQILVSAGKIGLQLKLDPHQLEKAIGSERADIRHREDE